MAKYLLKTHAPHADVHGTSIDAPPTRNPLVRFQRGFEQRFERFRDGYRDAAHAGACASRRFRGRLPGCSLRPRSLLAPFLGRNFFPSVDAGQILMHVRAPIGTRIEETAAQFAECRRRSARSFRRTRLDDDRRQHRPAGQRHQHDLQQHRHDRRAGWRHPDLAAAKATGRPPNTCARCARNCRASFPGMTFSFLPADIVSQILNFGAPAPIDLQVRGPNLDANFAYANKLLQPDPPHSRHRRRAHPAVVQQPDFNVDVDRTRAQYVGVTERDVTNSLVVNLAGSEPDRADVLAQPEERRVLSDRDADAAIPARLAQRAAEPADHRGRRSTRADARRHRRHHAQRRQRRRLALRHPADGADLRDHAGPRPRRRCAPTSRSHRRRPRRTCRRARRSRCAARCAP